MGAKSTLTWFALLIAGFAFNTVAVAQVMSASTSAPSTVCGAWPAGNGAGAGSPARPYALYIDCQAASGRAVYDSRTTGDSSQTDPLERVRILSDGVSFEHANYHSRVHLILKYVREGGMEFLVGQGTFTLTGNNSRRGTFPFEVKVERPHVMRN